MGQIITATQRFTPGQVVDEDNEGEYEAARPFSTLYVACLRAILQTCAEPKARRLYLDFGKRAVHTGDLQYVGVFTSGSSPHMMGWTLTVNWTPEKKGGLPPGHIAVEWHGAEVGMLAPFTDGLPVDGVPSVHRWHSLALVSEDDLQEACAAAITRATQKEHLFAAYHGDDIQASKHLA